MFLQFVCVIWTDKHGSERWSVYSWGEGLARIFKRHIHFATPTPQPPLPDPNKWKHHKLRDNSSWTDHNLIFFKYLQKYMQETKAKNTQSQFGDLDLESTQNAFIQKLLKECRQKVCTWTLLCILHVIACHSCKCDMGWNFTSYLPFHFRVWQGYILFPEIISQSSYARIWYWYIISKKLSRELSSIPLPRLLWITVSFVTLLRIITLF